jgi:hypothetical protein
VDRSLNPYGRFLRHTYLVRGDFGPIGCSWRETDAESAGRETLIRDLVDGQYGYPVRIVAFNTSEGWSSDVTNDIADELRRRFAATSAFSATSFDF